MAKGYVQEGKRMDWVNGTGSDLASGDVVELPAMIGIALGDIADGAGGTLAVAEVWDLPKEAALAIDAGDQLYWDDTAGVITKTSTDNVAAGKAFAPAAADDATARVLVNG